MRALLFTISLVVLMVLQSGGQQPELGLSDFSWLRGCWQGGSGKRQITEHWMKPSDALMMGIGCTVVDGRAVEYEFLQIRLETDGIYYVAKPSGQREASLKLTSSSPRELVFENPDHDFPQRITYRLVRNDSLHARIEGRSKGRDRKVDFSMRRVSCD
jgi:hypothetical protein